MENNSIESINENQNMEQKTSSVIATELVLEKLKAANINVITDQSEMQAILDAGIEIQKMAAHYGTNQNIETPESFNGYGVYVLSVNEENARNLGLKIASKKYGNSFYINNQPLQEFLQERNFSPYWQSVISQLQNPSNETLLNSVMTSDVKGNPVLLNEQNQLSTLCSLNLINYKREQTYLYSVEIPDNDGTNYLYYDKTIGLENADRINEELSKLGTNWKVSRNDTGNSVYFNILSNKVFNSQKQASEFLQKVGYVGMETSNENYIIFDDREMNINNRVQYMITENGELYGFAYNGQIYVDKNLMNSNVLAHEYTHLWDNYTKNQNPELWKKGKDVFKKTAIWNEVINDPSYQNIRNNEDEILSECHARVCGKFAQSVLERIAKENGENAKNAVIDWNKEVEIFVTKEFGFATELGNENYFSELQDSENMEAFLAAPMKDLMNGVGFEKDYMLNKTSSKPDMQIGKTSISSESPSFPVEPQLSIGSRANHILLQTDKERQLLTPLGKESELSEEEWNYAHSSNFINMYGDWELKIKQDFLLSDQTVVQLSGNEFSKKDGFTLTDQVEEYFNNINNNIESPFFGRVVLDREGADDSLAHGMGRLKAIAYAGVPNVIKNGVIIDSDINHKDRGYNSYVIAAPIEIAKEKYICEVVLKQNRNETRFYLHEVTEQKKFLDRAFVTNLAQKPAHQGTMLNILDKTLSVNTEISCPLTVNGEPEKHFVEEYMKSIKEPQKMIISNELDHNMKENKKSFEPLYFGDTTDDGAVNVYTKQEYIEKFGEEPNEGRQRLDDEQVKSWQNKETESIVEVESSKQEELFFSYGENGLDFITRDEFINLYNREPTETERVPDENNNLQEKILQEEFSSENFESVSEEEMTFTNKNVRSILLDYCEPYVKTAYYKELFGEEKKEFSDEEIRKLSKAVNLGDLLNVLDKKTLRDFAKDTGIPVSSDDERQKNLIVEGIKRLQQKEESAQSLKSENNINEIIDSEIEDLQVNGGLSEAAMEAELAAQEQAEAYEEDSYSNEDEKPVLTFNDTNDNPHYPQEIISILENFQKVEPAKWNVPAEEKTAIFHLMQITEIDRGDFENSLAKLQEYMNTEEFKREEKNYSEIFTPILLTSLGQDFDEATHTFSSEKYSYKFSTDELKEEFPVVKGEIKSILDNDFSGKNVKLTQDFQNELIEKGLVKPEEKFVLINEVEAVAHGTKIKEGEPFVTLTIPVDNDGKKEFVQTKYYHVSALEEPQKLERTAAENQENNPTDKNIIIYGETKVPEFAMITQHGLENFKDMIIDSYEDSSGTYLLKSEDGKNNVRVSENTLNVLVSDEYSKKAQDYTQDTKTTEKMIDIQYNDFFQPRDNCANNFRHNLAVFCRKEANSPLDALKVANSIISQMSKEEKQKTKELLNLLRKDGQTVNEVLIETYHEAVKETPLNEDYIKHNRYEKMIARPMYDTLSTKGEKIDRDFNLKIGDSVDITFKVDKNPGSKFSLRKESIYQNCTIISASKEGNVVTLMDGNKSFYDVPRDTFLKEYAQKQKNEHKMEKKVHRQQSMQIEIGR